MLVVERGRVGEEASGAAAGMLIAQADTAAGSPLLETALLARARHAALAAELEQETGIAVERSRARRARGRVHRSGGGGPARARRLAAARAG